MQILLGFFTFFPYMHIIVKILFMCLSGEKRQQSWYSELVLKIHLFLAFTLCEDVNLLTYCGAF